jgi:hypothetical protein
MPGHNSNRDINNPLVLIATSRMLRLLRAEVVNSRLATRLVEAA